MMKASWLCGAILVAAALVFAPIERVSVHSSPRTATAAATAPSKKSSQPPRREHEARPGTVSNSLPGPRDESPGLNAILHMPLDFELNRGQAPAEYAYVAHGPSYALGVSSSGLALSLRRSEPSEEGGSAATDRMESSKLALRLVGAAGNAGVAGLDPQPGRSNYFIGNDPTQWRTSVPHFNRVKIAAAYPGIDLVFYGNRQQLEYDFAVAPSADPGQIRLEVQGADRVELGPAGNAILRTPAGEVELQRPIAYQEIDGRHQPVDSSFQLAESDVLTFNVGEYDRGHTLVIDPVLVYSTAIGGSNGNQGMGLTVDSTGNAYVTGNTCSGDFPSSGGSFQSIHTNTAAKNCQDAFVIKLDPTATTLLFSDYIGGAGGSSAGTHVAADSSGVYVAGATGATSFPTVANIGRSAPAPCGISKTGYNCPDGFILKLSPDGSQLIFSSLLGGSQASGAYQVKLNPVSGDLVVLGETNSADFQPAPTTLETGFGGGACTGGNPCFNSFLLGLNASTGALKYGTYLGGAGNDWNSGLAFDASGNIYVAGSAQPPFSSSLGTVTHTYPPSGSATAAGTNLFVAKLNLSGTTLTPGYLTLVQADADTGASSLAVDASGNAYFAGATAGLHLGVTTSAFQSTNKATNNNCLWGPVMTPFLPTACGTGLVGKLDATGALSFLTYLGGSNQDEVEGMGLDGSNNIWLTGVTTSTDFPVSADHYTNTSGFNAPFLAEMSNDGTTLPFATLVGGTFGQSTDLVVDKNNDVYIAGFSGTVASTPNTYPADPQVFSPLFVQKWGPGAAPSMTVTPTSLVFPTTQMGAVSAPQTITVQNTGTVAMQIGVRLGVGSFGPETTDFRESSNCGSSLAAGASCTITVSFAPGLPSAACLAQLGCAQSNRSAAIVIQNNATQGAQTLQIAGATGVGPAVSVLPNPVAFLTQAAGTTTSTPINVQVENAGDVPLLFSSIALTGPNASDFQLSTSGNGGPACTAPLQPGTFCNLYLTFAPATTATGARTASLTLTDSAGDSPQTIPVTGTVAGANALNISPLTLSPTFPAAIGATPAGAMVLTLQNPGTSDIQVASLSITGTNQGDFSISLPGSCGTALPITVAKGSSCFVDIKFNPAAGASGSRMATLTVGTNPAITGLPTVALRGDAVTNTDPGMSLMVIPNPMNFGGLLVGEKSNAGSVLFTITNNAPIPCANNAGTCGGPLTISSLTLGLSDYTVSSQSGSASCSPFPATIASGSTCSYAIVFQPSAAGDRSTTLTIASNDPQGTVTLPVHGSGLSLPLGQFLQTALNFGNSAVGVASPPLTTTLQNNGLSNLTISSVIATPSANFAVPANTCTTSPLAPQATCTISVTFTPTATGPYTGTLTIADNGGFSQQQTVTLTGAGATGPQLRLMPPTLNFGTQTINTTSAAQTVILTSTGDSAVTFPANALHSSPDFILQSTTCGATLAPGSSCTASIQFKPSTSSIGEAGTLLVTDNATGSPQPVYMQGTGVAGTTASTTALTSAANPSNFGQLVTFTATVSGPSGNSTVPTGSVTFMDGSAMLGSATLTAGATTSATATLATSVLSAGSHSITAVYGGDGTFMGSTSTVVTQVVNAPAKAATTTAVTSSLNPAQSGQDVTFTATVAGPSGNTTAPTGSVTFMDGTATLGGATLNASGQATFTTAALSAGSHSVTAVYAGDANFNGSTSASLTEVVNAPALLATTTTVASLQNPSTPGQSVTFTATVAGPAGSTPAPTGTVTFLDGSNSVGTATLNSVSTASLSVTTLTAGSHMITAQYGGDAIYAQSTSTAITQLVGSPSFTLSTAPASITVTAGGSGSVTVGVAPTSGFTGAVSLACSGLPANSNCTFNPGSVTLDGTHTATSTVVVATDMAASLGAPARRGGSGRASEAFFALLLIGLGGLVRTRRQWKGFFLAVVLVAGLGAAISGCGGGSSGSGGPTTPKGTTTVTVTGTSGGVSQTATFTLVVQ